VASARQEVDKWLSWIRLGGLEGLRAVLELSGFVGTAKFAKASASAVRSRTRYGLSAPNCFLPWHKASVAGRGFVGLPHWS